MPTLPEGGIVVDHVWKRFRADRARPRFYDQAARVGRWMKGQSRGYRWVLKDINLEVEPGGSLGLIGINGSGKSTLLKIISHVTYQSAGRCETAGRIGALLEVRSGINPILTGRENIYLYGNILGLSRKQVTDRFDTIVEFAELTNAVDRQVKYFSSGMQVRLGFAIAAYLDPAILLVDEVLAVGDASFQQKCLQRISEVVASGTTLVFVSHDLAAVQAMCERTIWLTDAVVRAQGPTREVLGLYRAHVEQGAAQNALPGDKVEVLKADITGLDGDQCRSGEPAEVRLRLRSTETDAEARFAIGISEGTAMPIFVTRHMATLPKGESELRCSLRYLPVPKGRYYLWAWIQFVQRARGAAMQWQPLHAFDVFGPPPAKAPRGVMVLSAVHVETQWDVV